MWLTRFCFQMSIAFRPFVADGQQSYRAANGEHMFTITTQQYPPMLFRHRPAILLQAVATGWKNVAQHQFCVYLPLWRNCLGSGQLRVEDAVTTGYSGSAENNPNCRLADGSWWEIGNFIPQLCRCYRRAKLCTFSLLEEHPTRGGIRLCLSILCESKPSRWR